MPAIAQRSHAAGCQQINAFYAQERFSKGLSPFNGAETLAFHELIHPAETRPLLCAWMERHAHLIEEGLARSGGGGAAFPFRA